MTLHTHGASTGYAVDYDDPEYSAPFGNAEYAHYERDLVDLDEQPLNPYFGDTLNVWDTDFSRMRGQLDAPEYADFVGPQNFHYVSLEGVNAYDTDPWVIHAGDTNQRPRTEYTDGMPSTGEVRLLNGPTTGRMDPWSGYVAKLRTPQFGNPGPNTGYLPGGGNSDANLSVQIANEEAVYANQLAEQAINNSVFGMD